jgi:hypothetical protein
MSDQQAGWYPDPSGDASKLRYWNGSQWTNEYSAAPSGEKASVVVEETVYTPSAGQGQIPQAQPIAQAQSVYVQTQIEPTNGMAVASLIVSIFGFCSGTVIPSIVGIILAVLAKKKPGGKGLATGGLVVGIIGAAIWVIVWTLFIIGIIAAASMDSYSYRY